ncbi:hypothetical protein OTU49_007637, partial [Cherax quadricarinatus]
DKEAIKATQIAKFRALINEINEKERRKREKDIDMEETFNLKIDSSEKTKHAEKEDTKKTEQLNPFEQYLEKRKKKRKNREQRKKGKNEVKDTSSEEENESNGISDDELPEDVGDLYTDPFFAEELKKMDGSKNTKKIKKKQANVEVCESNEQKDLQLLLMDEDDEAKKHFSMREIIEEHKEKKKRRKNKAQKKQQKQATVDDFQVNVTDPRFAPLLTSGEYNIDPSHPQFKRTKAMDNLISEVQRKRMAETFENLPVAKKQNNLEMNKDYELSLLVKKVKNKTNITMKKQGM